MSKLNDILGKHRAVFTRLDAATAAYQQARRCFDAISADPGASLEGVSLQLVVENSITVPVPMPGAEHRAVLIANALNGLGREVISLVGQLQALADEASNHCADATERATTQAVTAKTVTTSPSDL